MTKPDKIIFLDIDGPMIPNTSFLFNPHASFEQELDERCVNVLKLILEKSGAKIVFNTTHNRFLYPCEDNRTKYRRKKDIFPGLLPQFEKAGFKVGEHIHETLRTDYPDLPFRLDAINKWLSENKTEGMLWVAFDDVEIDHKRAYLTDVDLGIGIGEFNHASRFLMFKGFNVL